MSGQIEIRIGQSSRDFLNIVWPQLGKRFGEIIPVESVTANTFAKELDARSGIDNWLIGRDGHMRGLASRVQWHDRGYGTFTIRVRTRYGNETEYHKRKREIATDGAITPFYVCQAYVSTDRTRLVSAAIGRMRDVIEAIDDDIGGLLPRNPDGSQGWKVPWAELRRRGAPIEEWPAITAAQPPLPLDECDWPPVAQPPDKAA